MSNPKKDKDSTDIFSRETSGRETIEVSWGDGVERLIMIDKVVHHYDTHCRPPSYDGEEMSFDGFAQKVASMLEQIAAHTSPHDVSHPAVTSGQRDVWGNAPQPFSHSGFFFRGWGRFQWASDTAS